MVGTAERAITQRQRIIVEELRAMADWPRPPYPSSSGFRSVYDRSASRDIADTSAVAQQLGVLIRSITEQELRPPGGSEPGTLQPEQPHAPPDPVASVLAPPAGGERPHPVEAQPPPPTGPRLAPASPARRAQGRVAAFQRRLVNPTRRPRATTPNLAPPDTARGDETGPGPASSSPGDGPGRAVTSRSAEGERAAVAVRAPSTEALLSVPATVAARERAELACRALAKSWYREAEELFLAGTELTPTDPFLWFGAGLAASRFDAPRAARHLVRSSRYLTTDDPPGAAYVAILAAALLESAGDQPTAKRLLRTKLGELNVDCPAISLHLARLGADRPSRLAEAISADPMLDADLLALGLDASGEVIKQRRQRTEQELGLIEYSITELRQIDSRPEAADPDANGGSSSEAGTAPAAPAERLSLAGIEVQLWRRIRACETEIEIARGVVDNRERARKAKEREVAHTAAIADEDLVTGTTIRYFGLSLLIAVGVVLTYVAGRTLAVAYPAFAVPIAVLVWLVVLGLVAAAVMAFVRAWWPHRRYPEARSAKRTLPTLEWDASTLREDEFMARRRFRAASQAAELRISRIVDRRSVLVPRRPRFVAGDLPLVVARDQGQPEPV